MPATVTNVEFLGVTFPNITDISISETPIHYGGLYKGEIQEITISGVVLNLDSGSGDFSLISDLEAKSFDNGFGPLAIGGVSIAESVMLKSINIGETDGDYLVEYTVSFVSTSDVVTNVSNTWTKTEENGYLTVENTVSAKGIDKAGENPLDNAKIFVNMLGDISLQPYMYFPKGGSNPVLVSTVENIDVSTSTYSMTNVWKIATATSRFLGDNFYINCSIKLNYDRLQDKLSANVSGTVQSSIKTTGTLPSQSDFDTSRAKTFAEEFVANSVTPILEGYSLETLLDKSYSITKNEISKTLQFSYEFEQVEQRSLINNNVLNIYTTKFSVSKDRGQGFIKASVSGTLTYGKTDLPIDLNLEPELQPRWLAVEAAFAEIKPRNNILTDYDSFKSGQIQEFKLDANNGLNENPSSSQIDKDPEKISISYSYEYTDKYDWGVGTNLVGVTLQTSISNVIKNRQVSKETIAGFANQEVGQKIGTYAVSGSAKNGLEDMSLLKMIVNQNLKLSSNMIVDSSASYGVNSISYSVKKYYDGTGTGGGGA